MTAAATHSGRPGEGGLRINVASWSPPASTPLTTFPSKVAQLALTAPTKRRSAGGLPLWPDAALAVAGTARRFN